jgi:hypothetical protein
VVGSALIDRIRQEQSLEGAVESVGQWFGELARAVSTARGI